MKKFIWLITAPMLMSIVTSCSDNGSPKETEPGITYPDELEAFDDISAAELVSKINIGWNLGNSLDCSDLPFDTLSASVLQLETTMNPVTTKENITEIKKSGFNAIRIPVSWSKVIDSEYNIRADWMSRVKEVVDYAADNGMYIILNTHHEDTLFKFTDAETDESLKAFKKIWEQIADAFKNYNEKLIFEALNEPRDIGSAGEWTGGTAEIRNNLNSHFQVFTDTVRESGGNNGKRILMITTVGASFAANGMDGLKIPDDPANEINKFIVSLHAYEPQGFALNGTVNTWDMFNSSDTSRIKGLLNDAYNKFVSNGIPVIMTEFAAHTYRNGNMNGTIEDTVGKWAQYFVSSAQEKEIKCVLWDDGGWYKLFNRETNSFEYPAILEGIMNGLTLPSNSSLLGTFNAIEDDSKKGWHSTNPGGPGDALPNAKYLVLELGVLPADNIHLVFNGSVIGWTQIDNIWAGWDGGFPNEDLGAHLKGKTLMIDLSKALGTEKYADFKNSTDWLSLTIFYSPGVDTLDIQRAYLIAE